MGQKWNSANSAAGLCLFFSIGVISIRFFPRLWLPEYSLFWCASWLIIYTVFSSWRWFAALAIGLGAAAWVASNVLAMTLPTMFEKQDLVAEGKISGQVMPTAYGSRFDFEISALHAGDLQLFSPKHIRLNVYSRDIFPRNGERWRFTVRLKRPHGLQNPGASLNYETWLFHQRIGATGYVRNGQWLKMSSPSSESFDLIQSVNTLRHRFALFLNAELGPNIYSGLLSALTVGLRSTLEDHVWRILQSTGTIHLVAISGLHIGLVSMLSGWLVGWIWRRSSGLCRVLSATVAGVIGGAITGLLYSLLAGFTLPTRRALAMLMVLVLAMLLRRHTRAFSLLCIVLALVLIIDLLAPLSISFWLSFGAVAILVLVAMSGGSSRNQTLGWLKQIVASFRKWWRMQLLLLLGMLPILLLAFQKVSLIAPVANLVAIPIIGFIVVPLSLSALLLWSIGLVSLAGYVIQACRWLLELIWQYLCYLEQLPWAIWTQGPPGSSQVCLALIGLLLLLSGRAIPARWLGVLWLLPMLFPIDSRPRTGTFKYTMLDVGQGLASVVQTENHLMVYDTGADYSSGFNLARISLIPYLRHIGVSKVDMMVISHGDNDHIGGAGVVQHHLQINETISSVSDALVDARQCEKGQHWRWDEVDFEVLWPDRDHFSMGNNSSCVIRVSASNGVLLLTGDIEQEAEDVLVNTMREKLKSDVLQVPHHGSKTSSSIPFLDAASPKVAVVSAGYLNRFRHPHPSIVHRYSGRNIALLNTAEEGALEITFGRNNLSIAGHRAKAEKFWQKHSAMSIDRLNKQLQ